MTDSSDAFCLNCLVWVYKSENIEAFCSCPCNLMCLSLVEFNLLPHKKHKNNEVKHSVVLSPSSLFLSHPTRYTSYFSCLLPVCMSYVLSHFLTVKLPCIQTPCIGMHVFAVVSLLLQVVQVAASSKQSSDVCPADPTSARSAWSQSLLRAPCVHRVRGGHLCHVTWTGEK